MASIHDSYDKAKAAVNKMKSDWGTGVSTRLILYNNSGSTLSRLDYCAESGRWENEPPLTIPNGMYAAFFHVKRNGSWVGSCGYQSYSDESGDKIFIGWSSPLWWDDPTLGVDVHPKGTFPDEPFKTMYHTKGTRCSDTLGTGLRAMCANKEDVKSPLFYYECNRI